MLPYICPTHEKSLYPPSTFLVEVEVEAGEWNRLRYNVSPAGDPITRTHAEAVALATALAESDPSTKYRVVEGW